MFPKYCSMRHGTASALLRRRSHLAVQSTCLHLIAVLLLLLHLIAVHRLC